MESKDDAGPQPSLLCRAAARGAAGMSSKKKKKKQKASKAVEKKAKAAPAAPPRMMDRFTDLIAGSGRREWDARDWQDGDTTAAMVRLRDLLRREGLWKLEHSAEVVWEAVVFVEKTLPNPDFLRLDPSLADPLLQPTVRKACQKSLGRFLVALRACLRHGENEDGPKAYLAQFGKIADVYAEVCDDAGDAAQFKDTTSELEFISDAQILALDLRAAAHLRM